MENSKLELIIRESKNILRQLFPSKTVVQKLEKNFQSHNNMPKIVLMDLPTNGNLGDQALVYAAKKFIQKNVEEPINLVEIPNDEINSSLTFLKKRLTKKDTIIWNGGGNLGTIYPTAELSRWSTFKNLKNQQIVMFPQSVFFDSEKHRFLKKSVHEYRKKKNLSVYLREQKSYDFFSKSFSTGKSTLVPDIVFSLEKDMPIKLPEFNQKRGIITLLRRDKEKSAFDNEKLIELLSKIDTVTQSDTYVDGVYVDATNRDTLLIKKWNEIAQHKLVVTDRLHGVIFAYLTKTPVLVIPNNNWKIESTYETWLQSVTGIEMLDKEAMNNEIIQSKVERLMQTPLKYMNLAQHFYPLSSEINLIGKE